MSEDTSDTATAAAIRILVPLDGSPEARAALPYAAALATPGTEIVLLTVVPSAAMPMPREPIWRPPRSACAWRDRRCAPRLRSAIPRGASSTRQRTAARR